MKAVCLLSGGMDSTTLAYVAKDMGYDILALQLNYGQLTEAKERHARGRSRAPRGRGVSTDRRPPQSTLFPGLLLYG